MWNLKVTWTARGRAFLRHGLLDEPLSDVPNRVRTTPSSLMSTASYLRSAQKQLWHAARYAGKGHLWQQPRPVIHFSPFVKYPLR